MYRLFYLVYNKPNKQGIPFFFPASGYRHCDAGSLYFVAAYGFYWVAGPNGRDDCRDLRFSSGSLGPLYSEYRSYGLAVRSAEEKKWSCVVGSYNMLTSATLHPPHARRGSPPFMLSWMTQSHSATPYNTQKD